MIFYFQADQICYCILCVFSYLAVGQNNKESSEETTKNENENNSQKSSGWKHFTIISKL